MTHAGAFGARVDRRIYRGLSIGLMGRVPLMSDTLIRADANQDGTRNIADVVRTLNHRYKPFVTPSRRLNRGSRRHTLP